MMYLGVVSEETVKAAKNVWVESWSKIWGRIQVATGIVILCLQTILPYVGDILNDPTLKNTIPDFLVSPSVAAGISIIGGITLIARRHKTKQDE